MTLRHRGAVLAAVLVGAAASQGAPGAATAASGFCPAGTGVTVVVDGGPVGGGTSVGCDPAGANTPGSTVVPRAGFSLSLRGPAARVRVPHRRAPGHVARELWQHPALGRLLGTVLVRRQVRRVELRQRGHRLAQGARRRVHRLAVPGRRQPRGPGRGTGVPEAQPEADPEAHQEADPEAEREADSEADARGRPRSRARSPVRSRSRRRVTGRLRRRADPRARSRLPRPTGPAGPRLRAHRPWRRSRAHGRAGAPRP